MRGIECAFSGRLGSAPELRMVKGGELAMCSFSVAADQGGAEDKPATWIRVTLFGEKAEDAAQRLAKGDRCYVEGRLSLDQWTGQDGTERHGLSVVASTVQPLGQIGLRKPKAPSRLRPAQAPAAAGAELNDKIPFRSR